MDAEKLASILIRHELASRQLDQGEADKIVRLLNAAIEEAKRDLAGRYAVAQSRGKDRGPARTKFLEETIQSYTTINDKVYKKIGERLEGGLIDRARHEHDFATKAGKSAGATIDTGNRPPDTNFLRALVNNTPIPVDQHGSALLKSWVKGMSDGDLRRFESALRTGIALGETPDQLAKRIEAGGWAKSRQSAQTVVLTANSSIANKARLETFKTMRGVTHVEWSSILDTRTSSICQSRSGTIYPIDSDHPVPPAHPRCRSILVPRKNDTDPPVHKPYSEWLKGQSADVQDDVLGKAKGEAFRAGTVKPEDLYRPDGGFKTLDELKIADAKITGTPIAPKPDPAKPFSPINPDITAQSIAVEPRRVVTQDMSRTLAANAADQRYDPVPEFRGIKPADLGKSSLTGLSDQAASMMRALMTEADAIADRFAVPRLRGVRAGTGSWAARMGDGVLQVNHVHFNGYAAEVGATGARVSAAAKLIEQRDALGLELKAKRERIDKLKATIPTLAGEEKDRVIHAYLDLADDFNASRKEWLKLDKKVLAARRTDRAAETIEASTWKPGEDIAKRPYTSAGYFTDPLDRARSTVFHEMAHHIHQMTGKAGRRNRVGTPPVEKHLRTLFFNKFHGRGPNGLRGYELKKLVATTYATTDEHEWFAENFAFYMMGRFDLVEDEARELIEQLLKEAGR